MSEADDQIVEDLVDFEEEEQRTDLDEQKRRLGLGLPQQSRAPSSSAVTKPLNPQARPYVPASGGAFQAQSSIRHPQDQPQLKRGWNRFSSGGARGSTDANGQAHTSTESASNKRIQTEADSSVNNEKQQSGSHEQPQMESASNNASKETSATELYVSNIPPHLNTIVKLAAHFSQFGEISNVKVDSRRSCALVRFANETSATAAFTSPIPVMNNRLIRVERYKGDMSLHEHSLPTETQGPSLKAMPGRNLTYRAPAPVPSTSTPTTTSLTSEGEAQQTPTTIAGLYDMPDVQVTSHGNRRVANAALMAHSKEVHKATMKVSLQEKYLEQARRKRAALSEKIKEIKGRLDEAAKMGKNVDPSLKASLMAEILSLTSEFKTAQASEQSCEGKLREAIAELERLKKNPPTEASSASSGVDASVSAKNDNVTSSTPASASTAGSGGSNSAAGNSHQETSEATTSTA